MAGQGDRVQNRLTGAVGADRIHRMRGVAQKRGAAERPSGQRIAIAQRVFIEGPGRPDQRQRIDEIQPETVAHERLDVRPFAGPVPVLASRRRAGRRGGACHDGPIGEAAGGKGGVEVDGIEDEFRRHAAGDDHGAAVRVHRPVGGAAPEHGAVPDRRPLGGIKGGACDGMDAVGAHQRVAARGDRFSAVALFEAGFDPVTLF